MATTKLSALQVLGRIKRFSPCTPTNQERAFARELNLRGWVELKGLVATYVGPQPVFTLPVFTVLERDILCHRLECDGLYECLSGSRWTYREVEETAAQLLTMDFVTIQSRRALIKDILISCVEDSTYFVNFDFWDLHPQEVPDGMNMPEKAQRDALRKAAKRLAKKISEAVGETCVFPTY